MKEDLDFPSDDETTEISSGRDEGSNETSTPKSALSASVSSSPTRSSSVSTSSNPTHSEESSASKSTFGSSRPPLNRTKAQRRRLLQLQQKQRPMPLSTIPENPSEPSQASSLSQSSHEASPAPKSFLGKDDEATIASIPSRTSSKSVKRRQRPYSSNIKRKRGTPSIGSQSDTDDNLSDNLGFASRTKKRKKLFPGVPAAGPHAIFRESTESMYGVQGTDQVTVDDCQFACSTISDPKSCRSAWQASVQLNLLLCKESSRAVLWKDAASNKAILEMWGSIPTVLSRIRPDDPFSTLLIESLGVCAHFVSLDCCISGHSVFSSSPQESYALRRTLLEHETAMQGFVEIAMRDSIVKKYYNAQSISTQSFLGHQDQFNAAAGSSAVSVTENASLLSSTATTPDGSVVSQSSCDPTAAGRRRRKHKKFDTPPRKGNLSFQSTPDSAQSVDSLRLRLQDQSDQSTFRVLQTLKAEARKVLSAKHTCDLDENPLGLPLMAVQRIIAGKADENAESCLDHAPEDPLGEDTNPLLQTNKWLSDNGVIQPLSQAMAETLVAIAKTTTACDGCLEYLHGRFMILASVVDGACLFHEANRRAFCAEGYTNDVGGCLIVAIMHVLNKLSVTKVNHTDLTADILRTVTSLTHENTLAASELQKNYHGLADCWGGNRVTGVDVVVRVLHSAVTVQDTATEKARYDCAIFCLNTLTNTVNFGTIREELAALKVSSGGMFIPWAVRWIIQQTTSFQDLVMGQGNSLGDSPSRMTSRPLQIEEDEKLVTAGNGLILLSCLMLDEGSCAPDVIATVHSAILAGIPGDTKNEKLSFITNTLRAFCNFYNYSVGDLSVAIVVPVKSLIGKLEGIRTES